jgi:ATP-dependent Lon protease
MNAQSTNHPGSLIHRLLQPRESQAKFRMSEAMEKVRGVRELPLFPLPVVLFPGVPLPLHIFEPRYRQMLEDIKPGNNLLGVSYFDSTVSNREIPPVGHVGCVAELTETQTLADGRSNILTVGVVRYRVEEYLDRGDPYLVGRITFFEDQDEDTSALGESSHEVSGLFNRIAQAIRTINDERANLPDISDTDPQHLSFLVAAAMEMDAEVKQELLELRSTLERLRRLSGMLNKAVGTYEQRARIHVLAKGNGHSGKRIDIE